MMDLAPLEVVHWVESETFSFQDSVNLSQEFHRFNVTGEWNEHTRLKQSLLELASHEWVDGRT